MPFDWRLFLTLAENLATAKNEAYQRTAISRAYYAAFHAAHALYSRHNQVASGIDIDQSHYVVWRWFQNHHSYRCRAIWHDARKLKNNRILADYRDDFPGIEMQTAYSLAAAKSLLDSLDKLG